MPPRLAAGMGLVRGLRSRAGYETPGETVAVADLATKLDGLEVDGEEPPPSIPAPPVRGLKNLGACESEEREEARYPRVRLARGGRLAGRRTREGREALWSRS